MSEHGILGSGATAIFTLTSPSGMICDLTPLILVGAKLTVLRDQLRHMWHVPVKSNDWAYHRLRNALLRWEKAGLLEYHSKAIDPLSVDLTQKSGVYVRATPKANQKNPNLIRGVQNSKKFVAPQNERISPMDYPFQTSNWQTRKHTAARIEWHTRETDITGTGSIIPQRCSWYRTQAIKRLIDIDDHTLFTRITDQNGNKILNPTLKKQLIPIEKLFLAWLDDISNKEILLRNITTNEYLTIPYLTRFTDLYRQIRNEEIYEAAIQNSAKKYQYGVFLTLTTDAKIWMMPKGEEFTRHIKDTSKTYHFSAVGKGLNLYAADRNESQAWRKFYEAECYRRGFRIPYIRVVEYQKNGLIHTHILLFGITWDQTWAQFAENWGTKYSQGFMNRAYEIANINGVWTWKQQNMKPDDSKGREPADYLMKYLKKAQNADYLTSIKEKTYKPGDALSHALYWATNKRFFTISQSLRSYNFDQLIKEDDLAKEKTSSFEFVGSADPSLITYAIKADIRRRQGLRPNPTDPARIFTKVKTAADIKDRSPPHHWYVPSKSLDNPDEDDPLEISSSPDLKPPEPTDYERLLEDERHRMEERRKRIKEKQKSGPISCGIKDTNKPTL